MNDLDLPPLSIRFGPVVCVRVGSGCLPRSIEGPEKSISFPFGVQKGERKLTGGQPSMIHPTDLQWLSP